MHDHGGLKTGIICLCKVPDGRHWKNPRRSSVTWSRAFPSDRTAVHQARDPVPAAHSRPRLHISQRQPHLSRTGTYTNPNYELTSTTVLCVESAYFSWRWRQQIPLKRRYLSTKLPRVIPQDIFSFLLSDSQLIKYSLVSQLISQTADEWKRYFASWLIRCSVCGTSPWEVPKHTKCTFLRLSSRTDSLSRTRGVYKIWHLGL